jgi:hypothetical protein
LDTSEMPVGHLGCRVDTHTKAYAFDGLESRGKQRQGTGN